MKVRILGSSAGGGFPQWNCNCDNCAGLRAGRITAQARTQSSIAVRGAAADDWVLINASPDIHAQLASCPALQPARARRDSALSAIVLVDGQIDHSAGLLLLREHNRPLEIYCTEAVHEDLSGGFPVFPLLEHFCSSNWHPLALDQQAFVIPSCPDIEWTAVPLRSEAPPYSPYRNRPRRGDNIGLYLRDRESGGSLFYAPGIGCYENSLAPYFERSDCLLVDGTMWTEDEMKKRGVGEKRAADMGHLSLQGEQGMLSVLAGLSRPRKILIHINNTNPVLDEESSAHQQLKAADIELAHDGMEFDL